MVSVKAFWELLGTTKMKLSTFPGNWVLIDRLVAGNALNCLFIDPCGFHRFLGFGVTHFTCGTVKSCKQEGFVIDERGKLRRFNRKKLSRRRCKTHIETLSYEAL